MSRKEEDNKNEGEILNDIFCRFKCLQDKVLIQIERYVRIVQERKESEMD